MECRRHGSRRHIRAIKVMRVKCGPSSSAKKREEFTNKKERNKRGARAGAGTSRRRRPRLAGSCVRHARDLRSLIERPFERRTIPRHPPSPQKRVGRQQKCCAAFAFPECTETQRGLQSLQGFSLPCGRVLGIPPLGELEGEGEVRGGGKNTVPLSLSLGRSRARPLFLQFVRRDAVHFNDGREARSLFEKTGRLMSSI